MPKQLEKYSELEKAIDDSKGKTIIIDVGAEWCGPCQMLAPIFDDLEKEFPNIAFYKVENDGDGEEIAEKLECEHMPTLFIYKDTKQVEKLFGTKKLTADFLRQKLTEHKSANVVQESAEVPKDEPAPAKDVPAPVTTQHGVQLQVKRLDKAAKLPVLGSANAAGYDLHALGGATVPARGKVLVSTGLAFAIPVGNYGRIAPRSGLAAKHSIDVGAGVIDADYRGEVKVLLFNLSDTDFAINDGDRIAQMIIEKYTPTDLVEMQELEETNRGAGGFGSTGVSEAMTNGKKRGLADMQK